MAALIEALKNLSKNKKHPSVIATFTTREEKGKMGSSVLKLKDKISLAFNFDGGGVQGNFFYQMLGEIPFKIILKGKAVHAAVEPEKGINALTAAAEIITKLSIGKTKDGKILNAVAIKSIDRLGNESDYMAKKVK